jgi:putative phosphoribosyl transferase
VCLPGQAGTTGGVDTRAVRVDAGAVTIHGDLVVPPAPRGVVAFAHGTGSGRHSPRNRMVAAELQGRGFATLLVDLLTGEEERLDERTGHLRFDIELLSQRLSAATDFVRSDPALAALPVGYFGASTGAGAALTTAAHRADEVNAVVSRGGRPDLAGRYLPQVRAATLLIVGGADDLVLRLNEQALARLQGTRQLEVVPGATHLFPEPGALERVAELAGAWLERYCVASSSAQRRAR